MKFSIPALTLALTLALALVPPFALGQECSGEDYDHGHSGYSDYDECACDGSDCVCVNDDSTADSWGTTCSDYTTSSCSGFDDGDFTAADQCCHCGGGTTTFDIPDFTTHSDTMGYCYSTWNELFAMEDTPGVSTIGGAWAFCAQQADAQGKTLVAMDVDEGAFYCQDACDCMADVETEYEAVITLASITTLPAECSSSSTYYYSSSWYYGYGSGSSGGVSEECETGCVEDCYGNDDFLNGDRWNKEQCVCLVTDCYDSRDCNDDDVELIEDFVETGCGAETSSYDYSYDYRNVEYIAEDSSYYYPYEECDMAYWDLLVVEGYPDTGDTWTCLDADGAELETFSESTSESWYYGGTGATAEVDCPSGTTAVVVTKRCSQATHPWPHDYTTTTYDSGYSSEWIDWNPTHFAYTCDDAECTDAVAAYIDACEGTPSEADDQEKAAQDQCSEDSEKDSAQTTTFGIVAVALVAFQV